MKKVLLFAALLLSGGILSAEPIQNGPRTPDKMKIWLSTNPAGNSSASKVSNSAFIHQVIVSSPAAVDYSTNAVLTIYGSQDGSGNILARVQTSTNEYTTEEVTRWTFDMYASSGMSITYTTGTGSVQLSTDQAGALQIVYQKGPPQDFKVWQSSFIPSDVTTHTFANGPVLLHKVVVLKAATGTSALRLYNSTATFGISTQFGQIDLTAGDREYDFDVMLSTGFSANINSNGTVSADVLFLFKKNPPRDWEYWMPHFASATVTTRSLFAGRGVFGGVLNGDNVTASHIKVYDSNGTANNIITELDGATVYDFDDANYDVHVTSGLTVTTAGNGQYTIRWRRLR